MNKSLYIQLMDYSSEKMVISILYIMGLYNNPNVYTAYESNTNLVFIIVLLIIDHYLLILERMVDKEIEIIQNNIVKKQYLDNIKEDYELERQNEDLNPAEIHIDELYEEETQKIRVNSTLQNFNKNILRRKRNVNLIQNNENIEEENINKNNDIENEKEKEGEDVQKDENIKNINFPTTSLVRSERRKTVLLKNKMEYVRKKTVLFNLFKKQSIQSLYSDQSNDGKNSIYSNNKLNSSIDENDKNMINIFDEIPIEESKSLFVKFLISIKNFNLKRFCNIKISNRNQFYDFYYIMKIVFENIIFSLVIHNSIRSVNIFTISMLLSFFVFYSKSENINLQQSSNSNNTNLNNISNTSNIDSSSDKVKSDLINDQFHKLYYFLKILLIIVFTEIIFLFSNFTIYIDCQKNYLINQYIWENLKIPFVGNFDIFTNKVIQFYLSLNTNVRVDMYYTIFIVVLNCLYLDLFHYSFLRESKFSTINDIMLKYNVKIVDAIAKISQVEYSEIESSLDHNFGIKVNDLYTMKKSIFSHKFKKVKKAGFYNEFRKQINENELSSRKGIYKYLKSILFFLNKFLYITFHNVIMIMTILCCISDFSIISLGYISISIYFLNFSKQLFLIRNYAILKGLKILRIYLLIDIILQIIFQYPYLPMSVQQIFNHIGIYNFTLILLNSKYYLISLKPFNLLFVNILIKIYSTRSFKEYIFVYFLIQKKKRYISGLIYTFFYNNKKLQSFEKTMENRREINKNLEKLKIQLQEWDKNFQKTNLNSENVEKNKQDSILSDNNALNQSISVNPNELVFTELKSFNFIDFKKEVLSKLNTIFEDSVEEYIKTVEDNLNKNYLSSFLNSIMFEMRKKAFCYDSVEVKKLKEFEKLVVLGKNYLKSNYNIALKQLSDLYAREYLLVYYKFFIELTNRFLDNEITVNTIDANLIFNEIIKCFQNYISIIISKNKIEDDCKNIEKMTSENYKLKLIEFQSSKEDIFRFSINDDIKIEIENKEELKNLNLNDKKDNIDIFNDKNYENKNINNDIIPEEDSEISEKSADLSFKSSFLNDFKLLKLETSELIKKLEESLIHKKRIINFYYTMNKHAFFEKYTKLSYVIKKMVKYVFLFLFENFHIVCYFVMILNHMIYNSMISLVWPISVFGYAMMENPRPKKRYWNNCILYALFTVVFKFLIQLELFKSIGLDSSFKDSYKIGIKIYNSCLNVEDQKCIDTSGQFIGYVVMDMIVVFTVFLYQLILISKGVWNFREDEIETINESINRVYLNKYKNPEDQDLYVAETFSKSTKTKFYSKMKTIIKESNEKSYFKAYFDNIFPIIRVR